MSNVIIIGGGPAGMLAGISAAQKGDKVTIIEKMNSCGKKLLITGKGRCNITSSLPIEDFIKNTPGNGRFLYSCYQHFTNDDIIQFLKEQGLEVKEESAAGFIISFVQYEKSPVILNFIAKRMINESLYGDRDNNLEYLIHSNFRSVDAFENYGEVNFLCNCIYDYDRNLCSYVFDKNSDVDFKLFFGQALKEIARVKRDWSLYMDRVNAWRVMVFNHELADYMLQDGEIGRLSHDEIISYVAKKLGVSEVFSKFDVDFPDMYDEDNYKILETVDVNNLNKAMSIARGLFSKDVIDEDYDDYVTEDDKDLSKKVVRFQLVDNKKGRGI